MIPLTVLIMIVAFMGGGVVGAIIGLIVAIFSRSVTASGGANYGACIGGTLAALGALVFGIHGFFEKLEGSRPF